MSSLGLSVCLSLIVPTLAFAGPACKEPAKGGFGIKEFGGPCPVGPEEGDYRESTSHNSAGNPADGLPDEEAFPKAPVENRPVAVPELKPGASAQARQPGVVGAISAISHWAWPGPESPALRERRLAQAKSDAEANEDDETLKDAPASLAPERYSLWAGLSQPLLLPSDQARSASPSSARELGERDYASHILQQSPVRAPSSSGPMDLSAATPKPARQAVQVELDISGHPGEWRAAAEELTRRAGFEADAAVAPRFLGIHRTQVVIAGTVEPGRVADILASPSIRRLESGTERSIPSVDGETRLLVGLRIPPDVSPAEALRSATGRLAQTASFRLERAIAYQRVPGTSQMVVVVLGRLPVRSMGALLSDPAVAKVAPSPASDSQRPARPPVPAWKSILRQAVTERSVPLLAGVLFLVAITGPFFRRRAVRPPAK